MSATLTESSTTATVTAAPQIQRPGRALIGWMTPEQGQLALAGRRSDISGQPEFQERARAARDAVAKRAPSIEQAGLVRPCPALLDDHVEKLRQHSATTPYFNEGWTVALVDLELVCSLQPCVFTDHAAERVAAVDAGDLASIAAVALPLPGETHFPAQFDEIRQTWILSSANPNLRIVGRWGGQVGPGVVAFGFGVSVLPSFLQVARVQGRYVLRDGYHRAYGFIRRGISVVPAFVREMGPFEDVGLPHAGLLPTSAYLGERPAMLSDFLNDAVSADVQMPAFQKMIVVHGLELTPAG